MTRYMLTGALLMSLLACSESVRSNDAAASGDGADPADAGTSGRDGAAPAADGAAAADGTLATDGALTADALPGLAGPSHVLAPSPPLTQGNWYVDGKTGSDSAAGNSLQAPFKTIHKALSVVQDGEVILVRGGTYLLDPHLRLEQKWASGVKLWGYGAERPVLDCSKLPHTGWASRGIFINGGERWHIKGFELVNAHPEWEGVVTLYEASHNVVEDLWIHDFFVGDALHVFKGGHNTIVDVVAWHMGDGKTQDTNVPDGFACSSSYNTFVRCVSIDGPDDGFDFYYGHHNTVYDSVSINAGFYYNGSPGGTSWGDGTGFKAGGSKDKYGPELVSGYNRFHGSLSVDARSTGFSYNQVYSGGVVFESCTAVGSGNVDFVLGGDADKATNEARYNVSALGTKDHSAESNVTQDKNSWNLGITDPGFVDAAQGNFFLSVASPCVGVGPQGGNLGASAAALSLYLRWKDTH